MKKDINIIKRIKAAVHQKEPTAKVFLYGSRARNDCNIESDWDILILVQKEDITNQFENELTDPIYELEFETGQVISPMVYSEKEWYSKYSVTSFFHNVMKEGIMI